MTFSPRGLEMLKSPAFEGYRSKAYPDSGGVPTIGYGTTHGVRLGQICTEADACGWLERDLAPTVTAVNGLVKVSLTQDQFDALVLFAYNVGIGANGLAGSTLLRKLNAGDFFGAASQFPLWDHVQGRTVEGLLLRREREQALFRSQQV